MSPAHSSGSVMPSGRSCVSKSIIVSASSDHRSTQAAMPCGVDAEVPDGAGGEQPAQDLDHRVARRNRRLAARALAAEREPRDDRDVLQCGDRRAARRARRARDDQVVGRARSGRLAAQLGALRLPAALEHLRQPVDHDVQEAADAQPDDSGSVAKRIGMAHGGSRRERRPARPCGRAAAGGAGPRARRRQTTEPSLKIGRYIATTRPPITTPRNTMMIGSSRLDSAATASSTSRS